MRRQSTPVSLALVLATTAIAFADLSGGLVAYYPFSGNAEDASGNGHDGVVNGATLAADRFGNPNNAYGFDGIDDYINVPYSDGFQLAEFTISAWISSLRDLSSGSGGVVVAGRGEDFTTDRASSWLDIAAAGGSWGSGIGLFYEDDGDTEHSYFTGVFPQNLTWTHIAATRATTGEINIYLDGGLIGHWDASATPTTMCYQDLTIGARWSSSTLSGPYVLVGYFEGALDEIRLYDRALSGQGIQQLAAVPVPGAALVGILGLSTAGWRLRRRTA